MCMSIDTMYLSIMLYVDVHVYRYYLSIMFFVDVHVLYNDMWMNTVQLEVCICRKRSKTEKNMYPAST